MAESDPATQAWNIGPQAFRLGSAFMRRSGLVNAPADHARADGTYRRNREPGHPAGRQRAVPVPGRDLRDDPRVLFPPATRRPCTHRESARRCWRSGPTASRHWVPWRGFTDTTLTDPAALEADLARIRHRGFSFDDEEERSRAMRCIAAPVFDLSGEAIAGISVSGPTHRIGAEHVKTLGAVVAPRRPTCRCPGRPRPADRGQCAPNSAKLGHEQGRDDPGRGMHLARAAGQQLDHGIADEAEGQAVGDGISQRHGDGGQHRRRGLGHVVPADLGQLAHHQRRDIQKRGRGRIGGHRPGQRRAKNIAARNSRPTTTAVRPVRPPACTPDALST